MIGGKARIICPLEVERIFQLHAVRLPQETLCGEIDVPAIGQDLRSEALGKAFELAFGRQHVSEPDFLGFGGIDDTRGHNHPRSEEHTSELQSLMRTSYAVICLKKKKKVQEEA